MTQLRILLSSLDEFKSVPLFIYDIDEPFFFEFKKSIIISSDGWGETFWIRSGKVIAFKKKYLVTDLVELVNYNRLISEK